MEEQFNEQYDKQQDTQPLTVGVFPIFYRKDSI